MRISDWSSDVCSSDLLNRRSFLLEADALWRKFAHSKLPACMLMLDLDHFKQINDLLDHEAGARAPVAFANLVQSSQRTNEVFGRVGGDEFALFLPDTSACVAREVAARIVRE